MNNQTGSPKHKVNYNERKENYGQRIQLINFVLSIYSGTSTRSQWKRRIICHWRSTIIWKITIKSWDQTLEVSAKTVNNFVRRLRGIINDIFKSHYFATPSCYFSLVRFHCLKSIQVKRYIHVSVDIVSGMLFMVHQQSPLGYKHCTVIK